MSQSANKEASESYFEQALTYTSRLARGHAELKLTVAGFRYLDQWEPAFDELRANRAAHTEQHELCVQLLNAAVRQVDESVRSRSLDEMCKLLPVLTDIFAWWQPGERFGGGFMPYVELPDGTRRHVLAETYELRQATERLETLLSAFEAGLRSFSVMWSSWVTTTSEEEERNDEAATGKGNEPPKRNKNYTPPGEATAKLIAALSAHHKYADGGALNLTPVGNNELAELAEVHRGSVWGFFKREFGSYKNYQQTCRSTAKLTFALRLMNGEVKPKAVLGERVGQIADD